MNEKVNKGTGEISTLPDLRGTGELQVSSQTTAVMQEIQGAMLLAKHYPRDYESTWQKLMESCKRKSLAIVAGYSYPRGGKNITGPSVNLARVAAQCYGNIRTGLDVLRNDETTMHIRAWAWDIEANLKVSLDDVFKKLIYRKIGGWKEPDERELRELVFRRGAILKRNCIFEVMPRDLIEDAIGVCAQTIKQGIKDPKGEAKKLILKFADYHISVEQIRSYIGHDEAWTSDDIVVLQGIISSINDGNSKASDYFIKSNQENIGSASLGNMAEGDPTTVKGYDDEPEPEKVAEETQEAPKATPEPQAEPEPAKEEPVEPEKPKGPTQSQVISSIYTIEGQLGLTGHKLFEYRIKHLDQADLSTCELEPLIQYEQHLSSKPKEAGSDF